MRYIDAYEVKRQIQKATEGEVDVMKVFLKTMYSIDKIPTADVRENVRGEWIKKKGSLWSLATCSVCGELSVEGDKPFCPNCGAEMKGDNNAKI